MSKLRSISNQIRLSQTFSKLSLRQRDLWHGLIATADDQGRLPGHPAAVRSLVWPYDDISISDVENDLGSLEDIGNIISYSFQDDQYIQIVNWWEYQNMQWAGRSKYPAPDGWLDRERYHTKGRKIFTLNWNTPGGFFIEVNDEVKDKDKVNVKVKPVEQRLPTKVDDKGRRNEKPDDNDTSFGALFDAFVKSSGIPETMLANAAHVETVKKWAKSGVTVEDVIRAVTTLDEKGYTITRPASIDNALIVVMQGKKEKPRAKKSERVQIVLPDGTISEATT